MNSRSRQQTRFALITSMALLVPSVLAGCATTTPDELVDARTAYRQAAASSAKEYAPQELGQAKQALDRAENYFKREGNESETRDLAYIAQRLSQLAEARAQVRIAQTEKDKAARDLQVAVLSQSQDLAQKEKDAKSKEAALAQSEDDLEKEKESFEEQLSNISGSVHFDTAKSSIAEKSKQNLTSFANALKMSDQSIIIEGHTDSVGNEEFNQGLSERRAEAVKDFMVEKGVPEDRVEAVGRGEDSPVADNSTPEGRAANRRVEIEVRPEPAA